MCLHYLIITAKCHVKPSRAAPGDHVIVYSLTEGNPVQPTLKSMVIVMCVIVAGAYKCHKVAQFSYHLRMVANFISMLNALRSFKM